MCDIRGEDLRPRRRWRSLLEEELVEKEKEEVEEAHGFAFA